MNRQLLFLILTALGTLFSLAVEAQSFRIHRGLEVTETRDPIVFAEIAGTSSPEDLKDVYVEVMGATFALEVNGVTQTTCTLCVTPSNDAVRYYYDICTRQTLQQDFGGDVAALIEGHIGRLYAQYSQQFTLEEILDETLAIGPDSDKLTGLPAGTEMAFYAMAVDDEGHCVGTPALIYFTTDPAGDPKDCTYSIDVSSVKSSSCIVSIEPSDASVPYWYGVCAVGEWPGDYAMTTEVSDAIYQYAQEYGISISNVASRVVYSGPISMEESGLNPGTTYYAYCYAMDVETGDALGPMTKVRFETTDYDLSDSEIALTVRYFDADALIEAYPERFGQNVSGRCYMQVTCSPNAYCYNWAVALAKGDLTDESLYPEATTKNAVLQGGKLSHEVNNFVCDWSPCTLLAFGVDAAGVDGPLQRLLISPSRSAASPVSEFITSDGTTAAPLSVCPHNAEKARTRTQHQQIIINNKYIHHEKVHLYPASRHRGIHHSVRSER